MWLNITRPPSSECVTDMMFDFPYGFVCNIRLTCHSVLLNDQRWSFRFVFDHIMQPNDMLNKYYKQTIRKMKFSVSSPETLIPKWDIVIITFIKRYANWVVGLPNMHIYIKTHVSIKNTCVYVRRQTNIHITARQCVCLCVYTYACVEMCVHMNVCMYAYVSK